MKVLLIKLKNLGDALLLTPVVQGIKRRYPDSHIAVLVRSGTEGILSGCPGIEEVFTSAAPSEEARPGLLSDLRTLRNIRARHFDWAFELTDTSRGRWFALLGGARLRITTAHCWPMPWYFKRAFTAFSRQNWHLMHRVEKDYSLVSEFLTLAPDIPPLRFDAPPGFDELVNETQPYAVIHPVSRWKRKAWPIENWVKIGRSLQARGLHCIFSSGPASDEVELTDSIFRELGGRASTTRGQRMWPELARLIKQARLFVGLDTAAMHLAAACQCPVVALFGPSIEHHWHPWKSAYEIVSAGGLLHRNYPDFLYDAEKRSMSDIQAVDVIAACDRMLAIHSEPTT